MVGSACSGRAVGRSLAKGVGGKARGGSGAGIPRPPPGCSGRAVGRSPSVVFLVGNEGTGGSDAGVGGGACRGGGAGAEGCPTTVASIAGAGGVGWKCVCSSISRV